MCKVEKPLTTENFSKSSKGGFGFNARCKTCVSIESKAKYLAYGRREFAVTLVEKHCPRCNTTKAAAEFGRATFRTGGLTKHCLECEKFLRDEKGYYRKEKAERPEFVRERSRQWRQKNLEKARLQDREYAKIARKRKPEVFREIGARKRAEFGNARPPWADVKAIRAVYRKARELEKADGVRRHVDHIIPLRNTLVCGLHVQNNLQILTWEENLQKTNKFEIQ